MIVDLKTREPPARSLLNRADQEFPSLGVVINMCHSKVAQLDLHVQNVL